MIGFFKDAGLQLYLSIQISISSVVRCGKVHYLIRLNLMYV